jgi:hypothetical protein
MGSNPAETLNLYLTSEIIKEISGDGEDDTWMWFAGGIIILVMLGLVIYFVKNRKQSNSDDVTGAGKVPINDIGGTIGGKCSVKLGDACVGKKYSDKVVAIGDTCSTNTDMGRIYECTTGGWDYPTCNVKWGETCTNGTLGATNIITGVKCKNLLDGGKMYECDSAGKWGLTYSVIPSQKGPDGKYMKSLCNVVAGQQCVGVVSGDGKTPVKDGDVCNNVNDRELFYRCTRDKGWVQSQFSGTVGGLCTDPSVQFGLPCLGMIDSNSKVVSIGDSCSGTSAFANQLSPTRYTCGPDGTWKI